MLPDMPIVFYLPESVAIKKISTRFRAQLEQLFQRERFEYFLRPSGRIAKVW